MIFMFEGNHVCNKTLTRFTFLTYKYKASCGGGGVINMTYSGNHIIAQFKQVLEFQRQYITRMIKFDRKSWLCKTLLGSGFVWSRSEMCKGILCWYETDCSFLITVFWFSFTWCVIFSVDNWKHQRKFIIWIH